MRAYIPQIIPIFPLPNLVLFPKIHLPLHIFEPRYREMVQDILKGDRLIGMALLKEGCEGENLQSPNIHQVGCVGKLIGYQAIEDGRYNIILSGLTRYRIKEEFHDKSYRQAWVKPLHATLLTSSLTPDHQQELKQFIRTELKPLAPYSQLVKMLEKANDEITVHALSSCLNLTPFERQFLLEAEDLNRQCRRLLELIKMKGSGIIKKKSLKKEKRDSEDERGVA